MPLRGQKYVSFTMPPMTACIYCGGNVLAKPKIPPCNTALPAKNKTKKKINPFELVILVYDIVQSI